MAADLNSVGGIDLDASARQAFALQQARRLVEAGDLYRRILGLDPSHAKAHHGLGLVLRDQGDLAGAVYEIGRALELNPTDNNARYNLARVLHAAARWADARDVFRAVVAVQPEWTAAWYHLGMAETQLGALGAAETPLREALRQSPDKPEFMARLAETLIALGRGTEAEPLIARCLERDPGSTDGALCLGRLMRAEGRLDEAAAILSPLLKVEPPIHAAWHLYGAILIEQGRFDEATAIDREAAARAPGFTMTYALAQDLLRAGDFAGGFALYHRWLGFYARRTRHADLPAWDGTPDPAIRLLVQANQGFGDVLQFGRYLAPALARCRAVTLRAPPALLRVLEPWCARYGIALVSNLDPAPRGHDCEAELESLPHLLGAEPNAIPAPVALTADPIDEARWRTRLAGYPGRKIGLVWAGNPEHFNDASRSMPIEHLVLLLELPRTHWFSLQVGPRGGDLARIAPSGIVDLAPDLSDFAETAAAIAALDLVIAVDTSIVHLAGSLGRPLWLLLSTGPDWRWGTTGETSAWYPSVRLFRQDRPRDWSWVVERVREALSERG